ncbi:hypothetical protein PV04_05228 [Phialophora macrospora]|uniref:Uncharacterized protein n=1 Tax=Phialophora macrospora TaxID=1851006 RepID=A0A0D2E4S2_9EURO|nr:hypothetical protein PV04_05228 [Phialophora macrospora]
MRIDRLPGGRAVGTRRHRVALGVLILWLALEILRLRRQTIMARRGRLSVPARQRRVGRVWYVRSRGMQRIYRSRGRGVWPLGSRGIWPLRRRAVMTWRGLSAPARESRE